jgi:C1A family cysteine protease
VPSRLFIYYNERVMEGTVNSDSGAQLRDGVKVVSKLGVCPETDWPYDISLFAQKPPAVAFNNAKKEQVRNYFRIPQNANQLKACLGEGFPFVFGFTVYDSFESPAVAKSGVLPMPQPGEQVLGGHAVCAVGYDDSKQVCIVRNSWGRGWGMKGYFTMPYAYITDPQLASDFWTMRTIQ